MLDFLKELIEGGFIGQALIGMLIWGLIGFLIVQKAAVDERLYDAGFIVIGYLFHVGQVAASIRKTDGAKNTGNSTANDRLNGH